MKVALVITLSLGFISVSAQTKKTIEISGSINSVDHVSALGNLGGVESKILDGGDYRNKSLAIGITGKYFFADNLAVRLRAIYTKRNIRDFRDLSTGMHSVYDIHVHQELIKIAPGIQWTTSINKFSFLGGFDLPITFHGKLTELTYNLDENLNGTNQTKTNITYTIPGGTSFGIGFFAGSNYYILKKLAIGFELGTAYEYTSVGGTLKTHSVTTGASNTESYFDHTETIKEMKFAGFQANINLTFKL